ncbi:hypothetical protein GGF41_002606, partial [Coemansia sp. RSA 2531]
LFLSLVPQRSPKHHTYRSQACAVERCARRCCGLYLPPDHRAPGRKLGYSVSNRRYSQRVPGRWSSLGHARARTRRYCARHGVRKL